MLHEVIAGNDFERRLVDHPLGNERSLCAMIVHCAERVREFVVHQHGEGAVTIVESAEAIGDAGHGVAVDRVARREERFNRGLRAGAGEERQRLGRGSGVVDDEVLGLELKIGRLLDREMIAGRQIEPHFGIRNLDEAAED